MSFFEKYEKAMLLLRQLVKRINITDNELIIDYYSGKNVKKENNAEERLALYNLLKNESGNRLILMSKLDEIYKCRYLTSALHCSLLTLMVLGSVIFQSLPMIYYIVMALIGVSSIIDEAACIYIKHIKKTFKEKDTQYIKLEELVINDKAEVLQQKMSQAYQQDTLEIKDNSKQIYTENDELRQNYFIDQISGVFEWPEENRETIRHILAPGYTKPKRGTML